MLYALTAGVIVAIGFGAYAAYTSRVAKILAEDIDYSNYELGRYVIDNLPCREPEAELIEADIYGLTEV